MCDDRFGLSDAEVACRQLGYAGGTALYRNDVTPGDENLPIHLDDLSCDGTEKRLIDCAVFDIGVHNCSVDHSEDVGVSCDETLVSNLDQPKYGFGPLEDYDLTQAFTTGANGGGYTVTSVEIALYNATDTDVSRHRQHLERKLRPPPGQLDGNAHEPFAEFCGDLQGVALPRSRL